MASARFRTTGVAGGVVLALLAAPAAGYAQTAAHAVERGNLAIDATFQGPRCHSEAATVCEQEITFPDTGFALAGAGRIAGRVWAASEIGGYALHLRTSPRTTSVASVAAGARVVLVQHDDRPVNVFVQLLAGRVKSAVYPGGLVVLPGVGLDVAQGSVGLRLELDGAFVPHQPQLSGSRAVVGLVLRFEG
jgi:hypothetical protein